MEKSNKDKPVDKFLQDNPQSSQIDSLILKYRDEVAQKSNDDFVSTRKLTIQPVANSSSRRIDEQITDLENLIKRIQHEIVELSRTNLKLTAEEDMQPTETQNDIHVEGHVVNRIAVEDVDGDIAPVYPIILKNVELKMKDNEDLGQQVPNVVGLNIRDNTEDLDNQVLNLDGLTMNETDDLDSQIPNLGVLKLRENLDNQVQNMVGLELREKDSDKLLSNLVHEEYLSKPPENVTDIRDAFSVLWNDEPGPVTPKRHGKSVEQLISELKAEINEKLESLHDVDIGQPLNNSDEE